MRHARYAFRRRGRMVWTDLLEVNRRMKDGTLSTEDRATYKLVFGCEPEKLQGKDAAKRTREGL